jgi:hypothetical protein
LALSRNHGDPVLKEPLVAAPQPGRNVHSDEAPPRAGPSFFRASILGHEFMVRWRADVRFWLLADSQGTRLQCPLLPKTCRGLIGQRASALPLRSDIGLFRNG